MNQRALRVPPGLKVPKAHKAPLDLKGRKASPVRKVRWGLAEWPVRRVRPGQSAQLALPAPKETSDLRAQQAKLLQL